MTKQLGTRSMTPTIALNQKFEEVTLFDQELIIIVVLTEMNQAHIVWALLHVDDQIAYEKWQLKENLSKSYIKEIR